MSLMLPKEPRIRDPKHLKRIRSLACCVCGAPPPSEACHIRLGLAGGMSLKPSDDLTVGLCSRCHRHQHQYGEVQAWLAWLQFKPHLLRDVLRAYARSLRQT